MSNDIVENLRKRAEIRMTAKDRKSVQEGKPDRLSNLLLEAADKIEKLQEENYYRWEIIEQSWAEIDRKDIIINCLIGVIILLAGLVAYGLITVK